jgi:two-component system response regulator BaeR
VSATVLIVEDEPELAGIVADYVRAAGHRAVVVHDGDQAPACIRQVRPDVVVLDLMLPGVDGLTLCREIRRGSDVPIIMTTAKVEEIDRVIGLESGAYDYDCRPYSPREMIARIGAQLRRRRSAHESAAAVVVDEASRSVRVDARPLALTPTEFALFAAMARRPGVIFTRAQLLDAVGRDNLDVTERAIDSHIKNLRRKLADQAARGDAIQSVYGAGYRVEF